MRKLYITLLSLTALIAFSTSWCQTNYSDRGDVTQFIDELSSKDGFEKQKLVSIFNSVKPQARIIRAMKKPYEKKPWHIYRHFFLKTDRIAKGAAFWDKHLKTLNKAQKEFGVPPEIIVAILGIETKYGAQTGHYRVIDSLSTLAFDYPPRAKFFRQELRQFLILSKNQHLDAGSVKGSYAGAIGLPQFIPSSIRSFAIDYSHNGKIDLIKDRIDAIGSIANYLKVNGWQRDGALVSPARVRGKRWVNYLKFKAKKRSESFKPRHSIGALKQKYGISCKEDTISKAEMAVMFTLSEVDRTEYWLGFQNFYAITRYNISKHYAMMVITLANEIKQMHQAESNTLAA